jgi:hypothetical protein
MKAMCVLINNSGMPIGGFTVEDDSGGDRLLYAIEPMLRLIGISYLLTDAHSLCIVPEELRDKVGELCKVAGADRIDAFKSPGRG